MAKNSVVQESTKKKKSNIRKREHSNWNGYVFMAPYAIIYCVHSGACITGSSPFLHKL